MPKELERDLGLYMTITISIGAMVGSGIFVLPGLAAGIAGPAVVLAYLLAGLVVLPAALSKAEMATAMPEAGGTYLYIDRAMGPLPGTIAGVGAWFSLVFKSAFALVGLGAYLLVFLPSVPDGALVFVSLALAGLLLVVNVVGVKQSGRLQAAIVSVVLLSLFFFVADGLTYVDQPRYHPFFGQGDEGLLYATGFVFVSYAGVTKIASVAEEVENPGRNIPIGILASVGVMMVVFTLVVFVIVGVVPADTLSDTYTPMAEAAAAFLGRPGEIAISVVAVLALTSMANAGILSSSRFPLAMSRDRLAPALLAEVNERFRTPMFAIVLTGALLLGLIAFVDVVELAKLASAFKILVFSFVNVALVAFRESDLDSYDPEFVAPGYPWVQLFGLVAGLVLLTQMGWLPLAGAAGLVVVGLVWYRLYGRERTEREGAAVQAIRQSSADRAMERTRAAAENREPLQLLVPVGREPTGEQREAFLDLIRLGADVVRPTGGSVRVVQFEEVPEQLDLAAAADEPGDVQFESDTGDLVEDLGVPVEFGQIVTHNTQRAIANFADHYDVDVVLGEWHPSRWRAELLGADVDWYMRNVDSDFVFVRNRGTDDVEEITLVADQGPFDPLDIVVADGIATARGATIDLVATVPGSDSEEKVATAREYLTSLSEFCRADSTVSVVTAENRVEGIVGATADADVVVVGTAAHHLVYDVLFGTLPDRLVERLDSTVVLTHSARPRTHTFLRAVLDRFVH